MSDSTYLQNLAANALLEEVAASPVRIPNRAAKPLVLRTMNESKGEIYWSATCARWQNLLVARNEFARKRLHLEGYATLEYKALPRESKRFVAKKIAAVFVDDKDGFFQYTRDNYWMQDAVGDQDGWIKIEGMATWHVSAALLALEVERNRSYTPPFSPGLTVTSTGATPSYVVTPFDPVRDSARENSRDYHG